MENARGCHRPVVRLHQLVTCWSVASESSLTPKFVISTSMVKLVRDVWRQGRNWTEKPAVEIRNIIKTNKMALNRSPRQLPRTHIAGRQMSSDFPKSNLLHSNNKIDLAISCAATTSKHISGYPTTLCRKNKRCGSKTRNKIQTCLSLCLVTRNVESDITSPWIAKMSQYLNSLPKCHTISEVLDRNSKDGLHQNKWAGAFTYK